MVIKSDKVVYLLGIFWEEKVLFNISKTVQYNLL